MSSVCAVVFLANLASEVRVIELGDALFMRFRWATQVLLLARRLVMLHRVFPNLRLNLLDFDAVRVTICLMFGCSGGSANICSLFKSV